MLCYNKGMKSKKGFTLLELSIVIAVSAVAMAMLSVVMVQANGFVATKNLLTARLTETEAFEKTFSLAIEEFQTINYSLQNAEDQNQLVFAGPGGDKTILFQENRLWKNEIALQEFQEIESVSFSAKNNIIKCTLNFDESTTHTLIFTKRI